MTEYQLMRNTQARGNFVQYNQVKKQELDGRTFDSKAEAQCYVWLKQLEVAGEITDIRHQVPVVLLDGPVKMRRTYKVDFAIKDVKSGEDIYIEVKGWETDRWKANLLLWRHLGPGVLRIYKVGWNRLDMIEEVVPNQEYLKQRLGLNK